jgi:putative phage-type endonuclease
MTIKSREEWLKVRQSGIGASECSAIVGLNPYMSNIELWEYKTGIKEPEDIGDKPYVKYGTEAEKYLRGLFALDFPQYKVGYKDFDIVRNDKYPFIFATLDGRLIERETGRRGILEIKTTEILKSQQKESWKDQVPNNYYLQLLHQLLATGWAFCKLKAQLKTVFDGEVYLQTKHYHIERADVKEDLEYLLEEEIKFWNENVLKKVKPSLILPPI